MSIVSPFISSKCNAIDLAILTGTCRILNTAFRYALGQTPATTLDWMKIQKMLTSPKLHRLRNAKIRVTIATNMELYNEAPPRHHDRTYEHVYCVTANYNGSAPPTISYQKGTTQLEVIKYMLAEVDLSPPQANPDPTWSLKNNAFIVIEYDRIYREDIEVIHDMICDMLNNKNMINQVDIRMNEYYMGKFVDYDANRFCGWMLKS